jgi:hypothetical protein
MAETCLKEEKLSVRRFFGMAHQEKLIFGDD